MKKQLVVSEQVTRLLPAGYVKVKETTSSVQTCPRCTSYVVNGRRIALLQIKHEQTKYTQCMRVIHWMKQDSLDLQVKKWKKKTSQQWICFLTSRQQFVLIFREGVSTPRSSIITYINKKNINYKQSAMLEIIFNNPFRFLPLDFVTTAKILFRSTISITSYK